MRWIERPGRIDPVTGLPLETVGGIDGAGAVGDDGIIVSPILVHKYDI